jgi:hypothetical protein
MIIMMVFKISTSHFSQNFISLFGGLFNDKSELRVRHSQTNVQFWQENNVTPLETNNPNWLLIDCRLTMPGV